MPSLKKLHRYPPEYGDLMLRACRDGSVVVPHSSEAAAKATRADLYCYRTVLRGEALAGDEPAAVRALLFDSIRIATNGPDLILIDEEGPSFLSEILDETRT